MEELFLQSLAFDGDVGETLPLVVVGCLAAGEVGDHGAEGGGEGAHVGADAAAAGCGAF